jgi:hypothetical protein
MEKENKNKKPHKSNPGRTKKSMLKRNPVIPKKSRSNRKDPLVPTLNMSESKIKLSDKKIKEFIEEQLKSGPYIVNIPMPKDEDHFAEYHAILVYVRDRDVLISDWGGDRRTEGHEHYYNTPHWQNYKLLLKFIGSELKKPVKFVEVDRALADEAMQVHESRKRKCAPGGEGGCSHYIFNWKARHLSEIDNLVIPESDNSSHSSDSMDTNEDRDSDSRESSHTSSSPVTHKEKSIFEKLWGFLHR